MDRKSKKFPVFNSQAMKVYVEVVVQLHHS
jgi:hypothetical protein